MEEPTMQSAPPTLFSWLLDHVHVVGWGVVIGFGVKAFRFVSRTAARFERAENTLNVLATNHLDHIETSMASVDNNLKALRTDMQGMRDDFKDFFLAVLSKKSS